MRGELFFMPQKAFTIMELVVVVAIIAILTSVSMMGFTALRQTARDNNRVADVKTIVEVLESYRNREGVYPTILTAGQPLVGAKSGQTFLKKIPSNPTPRADGGCTDIDYVYAAYNGGLTYSLSYCLGKKNNNLAAGEHTATYKSMSTCFPSCTGKCSGDSNGCSGTCSNTCLWSTIGTAGKPDGLRADYTSLFVYNWVPYVAFTPATGVYVVKYESGSLSYVGGGAVYSGASVFTSLYIYNGTPYVAYQGNSADSYKLYVKSFNGSTWDAVGGGAASLGAASHISLYVYNGTPYVAFRDHNTGVGEELTVRRYTGGAWETVGVAGVSDGLLPVSTSLKIDNGTLYVSFSHYPLTGYPGSNVYVMKYDGSWSYVGTTVYTGSIGYGATSLSIYNSTPYVAYCYGDCNYGSSGGEIGVKYWTGSAWSDMSGGATTYPCDNVTHYISLVVNSSGTPYVFFPDYTDGTAYVKKWNGSSWATVGTGVLTGASWYHSLFLYNGLTPYIAFRDGSASNELTMRTYQ